MYVCQSQSPNSSHSLFPSWYLNGKGMLSNVDAFLILLNCLEKAKGVDSPQTLSKLRETHGTISILLSQFGSMSLFALTKQFHSINQSGQEELLNLPRMWSLLCDWHLLLSDEHQPVCATVISSYCPKGDAFGQNPQLY